MKAQPNPKDSMKSTWRDDTSQWGLWHHLINMLSVHPTASDRKIPIHAKDDPMPYMTDWEMHKWIISHAVLPLILQEAMFRLTGYNFGPVAAAVYYTLWFKAISIHELITIRHLGHVYGFLDGDKHARDEVPDWSVGKVVRSLLATLIFRPMMAVILVYHHDLTPSSIAWRWLPVEIAAYSLILDFWFYWYVISPLGPFTQAIQLTAHHVSELTRYLPRARYHRVMHEFDFLWRYHRTHHLTKHPNPLLTLYADSEQEIMDIVGIPLMTWFTMRYIGMPLGFYEWWICYMYVAFSELIGHSGIRIYVVPPSTVSWLLRWTGTELAVEDHDLHHRRGWKKSYNYGKQTKLWDVVFGTAGERIECAEHNIDYNNVVPMPLFSLPLQKSE